MVSVTTTGTVATVVISELADISGGPLTLTHPVVDQNLFDDYDTEDIRNSASLQAALVAGEVTATLGGVAITSVDTLGALTAEAAVQAVADAGGGGGGSNSGEIVFSIDAGTFPITTGVKGTVTIPYDCTISQVTMVGDKIATVVADLGASTFAGFPGATASIVSSAPPTITAAIKSQDTTLTGWTVDLTQGDILGLSITSNDVMSRLTVSLRITAQ